MKLICVRAYSDKRPGDEVELPDGAEYSELYLAEPDSVSAVRAIADRQAADAETEAAGAGPDGDAEAAKAVVATALAADTEGK